MPRFALLKRLSTVTMANPKSIIKLNQQVREYIKEKCPEVNWITSFGLLGHSRPKFLCDALEGDEEICVYDYLDIFEAPDEITAYKVASIVHSFGHVKIEMWCNTLWDPVGSNNSNRLFPHDFTSPHFPEPFFPRLGLKV